MVAVGFVVVFGGVVVLVVDLVVLVVAVVVTVVAAGGGGFGGYVYDLPSQVVVIAVKPHLYTEVLHKLAGEGRR